MNDRGHLSSLELDLLGLGALPAPEVPAARAHLSSCERCRARLAELERARERFEAVRGEAWAGVEARLAAKGLPRWLAPLSLLAAAAAAALLVFVARPGDRSPSVKGDAVLRVFALQKGQVRELASGDRVAPGDRVRFVADGAGSRCLLLVSVDGAGRATVYVPFDGARSLELAPGRQELPDSVELDGTLGTERLLAFFSDRPLEAAPLLQALARGPDAGAALPPHAVFLMRKEAP